MTPRTQASVAVSADGESWVLLNASPDLRTQVAATKALQPAGGGPGARGSPVCAVVLTGGEVDQVAGLLHLRERQAFRLYATAATLDLLSRNAIFDVLAGDVVARRPVGLGEPFEAASGLEIEAFAVPGKAPLYMESKAEADALALEGNVGLEIRAGGRRLAFVPGAAAVTPELRRTLSRADVVLFDGTLFQDDEMIRCGAGSKTGRRMGHMPIDGIEGSLAGLAGLAARRIYLHLNNTNPLLIAGSAERRKVEAAGWEIAADGMEIVV